MKNKILPQLFIIYLRYILGFAFIFAAIVKIQGLRFTSESGAENPINSAWHYFETMYQSGIYWRFIGIGQFLAGFLLMTQRYSKLGAVLFFTIIANIFVVTISYDFNYTPVITGLMLLSSLLLILWDWSSFKILFNQTPVIDTTKRLENDRIWEIFGLILCFITVIIRLNMHAKFVGFGFLILLFIGIIGLFLGLKKRKLYR
ncbi:hypothetical protein [Tenacibaculum sp. 190524A02b]|uniref:DoxX family protein n=1 Tax=Tenacibaculum vairaonense TaxID=3137860 RepID=A0ABP1FD69_9FLAO